VLKFQNDIILSKYSFPLPIMKGVQEKKSQTHLPSGGFICYRREIAVQNNGSATGVHRKITSRSGARKRKTPTTVT
jgi:hypothetical protein